jgi:hypothetical protein
MMIGGATTFYTQRDLVFVALFMKASFVSETTCCNIVATNGIVLKYQVAGEYDQHEKLLRHHAPRTTRFSLFFLRCTRNKKTFQDSMKFGNITHRIGTQSTDRVPKTGHGRDSYNRTWYLNGWKMDVF